MPRLKPKPKPDKQYRCVMPFSTVDGRTFNTATVLLGSDPAVREHSAFFTEEGVPAEERQAAMDELMGDVSYDRSSNVTVLDPIPPEMLAVATTTFHVGGPDNARFIERGQRVRRDDEIVKRFPEHFTTAPVPIEKAG